MIRNPSQTLLNFGSLFSENALNPMTFPSLRRFESEVLEMALALLHAPEGAAGSMSSGGSESLLLAVKTARDWARAERPDIVDPEILVPVTAHPDAHEGFTAFMEKREAKFRS